MVTLTNLLSLHRLCLIRRSPKYPRSYKENVSSWDAPPRMAKNLGHESDVSFAQEWYIYDVLNERSPVTQTSLVASVLRVTTEVSFLYRNIEVNSARGEAVKMPPSVQRLGHGGFTYTLSTVMIRESSLLSGLSQATLSMPILLPAKIAFKSVTVLNRLKQRIFAIRQRKRQRRTLRV